MIIREIEVKTWEWGWCWGGADRSPCSRPAESRLLAVLATLQRFGGNFGSENFVAARILEASQGGAVAEGWSSGGEGESGGRVVGAPWHDALHGRDLRSQDWLSPQQERKCESYARWVLGELRRAWPQAAAEIPLVRLATSAGGSTPSA